MGHFCCCTRGHANKLAAGQWLNVFTTILCQGRLQPLDIGRTGMEECSAIRATSGKHGRLCDQNHTLTVPFGSNTTSKAWGSATSKHTRLAHPGHLMDRLPSAGDLDDVQLNDANAKAGNRQSQIARPSSTGILFLACMPPLPLLLAWGIGWKFRRRENPSRTSRVFVINGHHPRPSGQSKLGERGKWTPMYSAPSLVPLSTAGTPTLFWEH